VPDLAPLLGEADALLLTSRFEGTPAVVIEALAAGVPVVATGCSPFVMELLDGPGRGRLVEERKATALAGALLETLDAPGPMPGIEDVLAPFATGAIAARYLALFEALLSGAD
jgi:glycosyltransferase involved in cell wall biosynthesis